MRWFWIAPALLLLGESAAAEELEALLGQLPVQQLEQFAAETGASFADIVRTILSGEIPAAEDWGRKLLETAIGTAREYGLCMAGIMACACIGAAARSFSVRKAAASSVFLLGRVTVGLMLMQICAQSVEAVTAVCERLRMFTDLAAPVLVTALTLSGSPSMAAAVSPSAVIADSLSVCITTDFGLPLLRCASALAVFAGFSSRFRLERLFGLMYSTVKWLLGGCMTGFLALMSVRSIALGGKDGVTVQTARYAVDNLLPIIGGELADTVGNVFASAALLKNVTGLAVCVMIIAVLIAPAIRLAVLVLMLKMTSAALDMLAEPEMSGMLDRCVQVLEGLMAVLAAVASLGLILAGAAIMTAGARG